MALDSFELPRLDWYDAEGRIYKDALIENFNAIEDKLTEISKLSPYEVQFPDFATLDYDDVTLDSPANKVVNLKSFVDIMNIKGVPIKCVFSGTKCVLLSYYDDNYKLHEIRNQEVDELGEDGKIFVVIDTTTDTISATDNIDNLDNKLLIGVYDNDALYHIKSNELADINILTALCNMSEETNNFYIPRDYSIRTLVVNGRALGAANVESGGVTMNLTLTDTGRLLK